MTTPEQDAEFLETTPGHWRLLRDLIAFQFKLAADGLRDLLLSPLSIGAAIFGMIASPDNPGKYFSNLLQWGHKTDRWINLFGAVEHYEEGEISSDTYVRKVEDMIKKEYEKGGVVRSFKDGTDGIIGKVTRKDD